MSGVRPMTTLPPPPLVYEQEQKVPPNRTRGCIFTDFHPDFTTYTYLGPKVAGISKLDPWTPTQHLTPTPGLSIDQPSSRYVDYEMSTIV